MSIIREFQEFAIKGNMVDMAVGIIIGAAFGKVVTSLVNDIIMPPIGMLIGGMNFRELAITLREAVIEDGIETAAAVQINYGAFVNNMLDFLIVAMAIFIVVKGINTLRRQAEARMKRGEDPVPPA